MELRKRGFTYPARSVPDFFAGAPPLSAFSQAGRCGFGSRLPLKSRPRWVAFEIDHSRGVGQDQDGLIIPVAITIYVDRTFTFITKTPPVPVLIKRAVNLAKGSGAPNKNKVGKITEKQVEEIAKIKMPDLNCCSLASAVRSVKGTARSMGVDVV